MLNPRLPSGNPPGCRQGEGDEGGLVSVCGSQLSPKCRIQYNKHAMKLNEKLELTPKASANNGLTVKDAAGQMARLSRNYSVGHEI